jgi:hypothetical protein
LNLFLLARGAKLSSLPLRLLVPLGNLLPEFRERCVGRR